MKNTGLRMMVSGILLVLMAAGSFAGGSGEKSADTRKAQVLKYWDVIVREPHPKARDAVIADYMKANPNITVEVTTLTGDINQKILTSAAAKTLPDYLSVWGPGDVVTWGQMGIVATVDDVVKDLGKEFFLSSRQLEQYQLGGNYWGIPQVTFPVVMWYRADWFKEKGITDPPKTWDEWYKVAKQFVEDTNKDGKIDRWGLVLGIAEGWPYSDIRGSNADYWWDKNGNSTIGPKTVETLDFLRKMFKETTYPGSTTFQNEGQRIGFIAGQGATMVTSVSFINTLIEEKGLDWFGKGSVKIAPIPMNRPFSEGAGTGASTHALGIVAGPNEQLAKQFMKYWVSKDASTKYFSNNIPGHLPPFKAVWDASAFRESRKAYWSIYETGRDIIANTQWFPPTAKWEAIFNAEGGSGKLVMGAVTVENKSSDEIVANLKKAMEKAKAELK